jgi:Bacillithiol biosynthesis BshC
MAFECRLVGRLATSTIGNLLFRDWVGTGVRVPGTSGTLAATAELARVMTVGSGETFGAESSAPLFVSSWKKQWDNGLGDLLQGRPDASGYQEIGRRLVSGECDVVVTGQQPGFLGGPLYTLYKIATTIALARQRTAKGRPTVPVFWSGDDDDDLAEAFGTAYWGPGDEQLRWPRTADAAMMKNRRFRPIGDFPAKSTGPEAGRWLAAVAAVAGTEATGGSALASDMARLWADAEAGDWTWGQLQHRALMRVFAGCGLVIVSGNDPNLHEAAAPLYERLLADREELSSLARLQGEKLAAGGWHAQMSPRSLARPLFQLQDGRRVHLEPDADEIPAGRLRPGVLMRSLVQDWLLRPAAVVVGPGELAYLRQMDPLYEALGVPRSPLVPRLFGWLAPQGFETEVLMRHGASNRFPATELEEMADAVSGGAEVHLTRVLAETMGLDPIRSAELAKGRARRFRKGVLALLSAESARKDTDERPTDPIWVFPDGTRQERGLASFCAAALWGDDLVMALLRAADDHLESGLRGAWSEYVIDV